jgi:nitrate reductase NapD
MQTATGINISSLVVAALPARTGPVQAALAELPGVEVHAVAEDGRMVVTIDADSDDSTVKLFETIRQTPGVLSAAMVYHQHEPDPDKEA